MRALVADIRSFENRHGRLILKADIGMRGETWKFEAVLEKIGAARD